MSDAPQGPDWWQASDDKWYPPPRPEMPGDVPASSPPVGVQGYAAPGYSQGPPLGPPSGGYPPAGPPGGGYPPAGPPMPGGYPPGTPSGPYGVPGPGAPGGYPPGPGGNRTPMFVAIGTLAAVALIGLILVVSNGGGDDDDAHQREPVSTATTPTAESTTAPDGTTDTTDGGGTVDGSADVSQLALVESGFTASEDGGSYGIIIQNNGTEMVTNFHVQVAVYDANDTVVRTDRHLVAKLGPAEKLGIGYDLLSDDVANGVDHLDVQFEDGFGDSVPDGTFEISEVATTTDQYGTETTFVVTSTYGIDVDGPYAYVIYRNSAGEIIGGTYGFVDMVPAGGRAAGTLTSFDPVDGIATSEVYVDAGVFV
jgi:hypothetical protein